EGLVQHRQAIRDDRQAGRKRLADGNAPAFLVARSDEEAAVGEDPALLVFGHEPAPLERVGDSEPIGDRGGPLTLGPGTDQHQLCAWDVLADTGPRFDRVDHTFRVDHASDERGLRWGATGSCLRERREVYPD